MGKPPTPMRESDVHWALEEFRGGRGLKEIALALHLSEQRLRQALRQQYGRAYDVVATAHQKHQTRRAKRANRHWVEQQLSRKRASKAPTPDAATQRGWPCRRMAHFTPEELASLQRKLDGWIAASRRQRALKQD
jgi:hypothetical protein